MMPVLRRNLGGYDNLADALDREFNRLWRNAWSNTDDNASVASYPIDIHEDDKQFHIEAEMPGFQKQDIQITYENGILSLTAQRKTDEPKGQPHLHERRFTRVSRSFTVPTSIDPAKIDAKLENGVLYLTLHKTPEVQPKRIEIK